MFDDPRGLDMAGEMRKKNPTGENQDGKRMENTDEHRAKEGGIKNWRKIEIY